MSNHRHTPRSRIADRILDVVLTLIGALSVVLAGVGLSAGEPFTEWGFDLFTGLGMLAVVAISRMRRHLKPSVGRTLAFDVIVVLLAFGNIWVCIDSAIRGEILEAVGSGVIGLCLLVIVGFMYWNAYELIRNERADG
jgi:hypothetical protein